MPAGVAVPAASSGFRFGSSYLLLCLLPHTELWTALIPDSENSLESCLAWGFCQLIKVPPPPPNKNQGAMVVRRYLGPLRSLRLTHPGGVCSYGGSQACGR